eukprot:6179934-Pleurochrysis_carterae.AAC.1
MKARLCFWYGRSDARSPAGSGSSSGYTCATSCITRSAVHAIESRGGATASRLRRSDVTTVGMQDAAADTNGAPGAGDREA